MYLVPCSLILNRPVGLAGLRVYLGGPSAGSRWGRPYAVEQALYGPATTAWLAGSYQRPGAGKGPVVLGHLPAPCYALLYAVVAGHLGLFDAVLGSCSSWLARWRLLLLWERARICTWASLVRRRYGPPCSCSVSLALLLLGVCV